MLLNISGENIRYAHWGRVLPCRIHLNEKKHECDIMELNFGMQVRMKGSSHSIDLFKMFPREPIGHAYKNLKLTLKNWYFISIKCNNLKLKFETFHSSTTH